MMKHYLLGQDALLQELQKLELRRRSPRIRLASDAEGARRSQPSRVLVGRTSRLEGGKDSRAACLVEVGRESIVRRV
jgi:hypothetical protein